MRSDRDTEVLKIQVLADYYHSKFTSSASYVFGAIIAWAISFAILFFQHNIDIITFYSGIFVGAIGFSAILFYTYREYHTNLNKIDELIQQVNKGEPLPSLKELKKKR